jgi:histidine kinase/DNA gyrase B/HSP90-like ATPase
MSRQLHPSILDDLGLEVALREECRSFSQRVGILVQFQADNVPRSIPGDIALCLYRVGQESLRNIDKHAHAKEARMLLALHQSDLILLIEDVGDGFNLKESGGRGGLGLISINEPVQAVNGDFSIRSQLGTGTEIEVRVPLQDIVVNSWSHPASSPGSSARLRVVLAQRYSCMTFDMRAYASYFGIGKPFMQTTVRSASSGFAWAEPRLAVQRTSPFKTRLVLLSATCSSW